MKCVLRNGFGRFFNDTEGLSICQGSCVLIAMPPCSCCDSRISFWLCNMILTVCMYMFFFDISMCISTKRSFSSLGTKTLMNLMKIYENVEGNLGHSLMPWGHITHTHLMSHRWWCQLDSMPITCHASRTWDVL